MAPLTTRQEGKTVNIQDRLENPETGALACPRCGEFCASPGVCPQAAPSLTGNLMVCCRCQHDEQEDVAVFGRTVPQAGWWVVSVMMMEMECTYEEAAVLLSLQTGIE